MQQLMTFIKIKFVILRPDFFGKTTLPVMVNFNFPKKSIRWRDRAFRQE
jgi:hypothetical protein